MLLGRDEGNFLVGQQGGAFEQAAKFFFGDVVVRAFLAVRIRLGFVIHGQSFHAHDAEIRVALFPDLALLELERHERSLRERASRREAEGICLP